MVQSRQQGCSCQPNKRRELRCKDPDSTATHQVLLKQALGVDLPRSHCSLQQAFYLNRQAHCLRPNSFNQAAALDKAFCSAWLDTDHVLVGTKCNTLVSLHIPSRTHTVVAYPQQPVHRQGPDLFTGPRHSCGQHAIAVSPDGCFVATGGQHTQDIILWQVQHGLAQSRQASTTLWPAQTLMGHVDWVFGLAWTSSRHFVSASRDKTIKLWQVPSAAVAGDCGPCQHSTEDHGTALLSVKFHKDKVRDVKFDQQQQQVIAACVDGSISWWSPDLLLRGSCWLPTDYEEPVTVQPCGSLLVVGCKQEALLIDTRVGQRVAAAVAVPTCSSSKRRRVVPIDGGPTQPGQDVEQQGLPSLQQETRQAGSGIQQQPCPQQSAATEQQDSQQRQDQHEQQDSQQGQEHAGQPTGSDSEGHDSEENDNSNEVDELNVGAPAIGSVPVNQWFGQYVQQQLHLQDQPPAVHYAHQRAWETMHQQQRLLAVQQLRGQQQQQGLKRLLHQYTGSVVVPPGHVCGRAADVHLEAELSGELCMGKWGVRSLSLQRHLLGIGTGEGNLFLHDLRRMSDHNQGGVSDSSSPASSLGLVQCEYPSAGFAAPPAGSEVFADPDPSWKEESWGQLPARVHKLMLPDAPTVQPDALLLQAGLIDRGVLTGGTPSAVYTHCWDPSGMRLFVGGGPLQMGYRACSLALYAA